MQSIDNTTKIRGSNLIRYFFLIEHREHFYNFNMHMNLLNSDDELTIWKKSSEQMSWNVIKSREWMMNGSKKNWITVAQYAQKLYQDRVSKTKTTKWIHCLTTVSSVRSNPRNERNCSKRVIFELLTEAKKQNRTVERDLEQNWADIEWYVDEKIR